MDAAQLDPERTPTSGPRPVGCLSRIERLLEAAHHYRVEHGAPPTGRELAIAMGLASRARFNDRVTKLLKQGLIVRQRFGAALTIELTPEGRRVLGIHDVVPLSERELRLRNLLARAATLLTNVAKGSPLLEQIAAELAS